MGKQQSKQPKDQPQESDPSADIRGVGKTGPSILIDRSTTTISDESQGGSWSIFGFHGNSFVGTVLIILFFAAIGYGAYRLFLRLCPQAKRKRQGLPSSYNFWDNGWDSQFNNPGYIGYGYGVPPQHPQALPQHAALHHERSRLLPFLGGQPIPLGHQPHHPVSLPYSRLGAPHLTGLLQGFGYEDCPRFSVPPTQGHPKFCAGPRPPIPPFQQQLAPIQVIIKLPF